MSDLRVMIPTMPTAPPPDDASTSEPAQPKLTRKERARQLRRAAYLKAKEQRANDPRLAAIKEAMKKRRREQYEVMRERRKAALAERQAKTRATNDAAMRQSLKAGTKPD
jgi:hypothetical protein